MTDLIGELFGERAFQGPAYCIVGRSPEIEGISRIKIAGTVLTDTAQDAMVWQRWRGQLIFVPDVIEVPKAKLDYRLEQMLLGPLGNDDLWKAIWEKQ